MEFCDRLATLRKTKGWSQENLADYLDVSRQSVSKWESGSSMPDLAKLIVLADLFSVSLDELVRGMPIPVTTSFTPVIPTSHLHYEYKSKLRILGLPLVHVHFRRFAGPPKVARGIIAVGDIAVGLVSVGALSLGVLSIGAIAAGAGLAMGGIALGGHALGGIAIGVYAFGGLAIGMWAAGGGAFASKVALGGLAVGPVAIGGEAISTAGVQLNASTPPMTLEVFRKLVLQHAPRTAEWFIQLGWIML